MYATSVICTAACICPACLPSLVIGFVLIWGDFTYLFRWVAKSSKLERATIKSPCKRTRTTWCFAVWTSFLFKMIA